VGILTVQAQQYPPTSAAPAAVARALVPAALLYQWWPLLEWPETALVLVAAEHTVVQQPQQAPVVL
jgi:hypothetical protein